MFSKFKIRNLMINVAPEGDPGCTDQQSDCGTPSCFGDRDYAASNCGMPSCIGDKCMDDSCRPEPPPTNCDEPSCLGDRDEKYQAKSLSELTRSNLALLQRELRQALNPER
ncbi:MAG TPA: hypothetical protein VKK31_10930 [Thermoanaerobaculia bacterium]|nr:hypothetical protein [Thermoanaerobaculia bacterium]